MSKELEEFKEEIRGKIDEILNIDRHYMVKIEQLKELSEELKPKPEFIEGEHVLVSDGGNIWHKSFFVRLVDREYNYECENNSKANTLWKYCKKIESLSIHMTDHDGGAKYPDNVMSDTLICGLISNGGYAGGLAHEFDWNHVVRYQVLKDLEADS